MMFSHAALNATLNATSAILLAVGYAAIRAGKREAHKRFMISAFLVSCTFLVSYLVYHYRVGHVVFKGQGWIRPVYFALLISHTILAVVIVPLILITLRRAWLERFDKHRLIARWTLPLWLYVSITGVIVYVMVYRIYNPSLRASSSIPSVSFPADCSYGHEPLWPAGLSSKRLTETVRLRVIMNADGSISVVRALSGEPVLVEAALNALRQCHIPQAHVQAALVGHESEMNVAFSVKR